MSKRPLTADELDLLRAVAAGAHLGDAARDLHISRRTADRRLARIRTLLDADTTAQAVATARRGGLV